MFDAPRAAVFRAWSDAGQLAQWWGPKGFTNPVCEIDVRVGGAIRIHMRSPDGNIYPMKGEFPEIGPPGRLLCFNIAVELGGPRSMAARTQERRSGGGEGRTDGD